MTAEEEFKERSQRIAGLFFKQNTAQYEYLVFCIAMELKSIAQECGWQKEYIKHHVDHNHGAIKPL